MAKESIDKETKKTKKTTKTVDEEKITKKDSTDKASLEEENKRLKEELEEKRKEEEKREKKELIKKVWNIFAWTVVIIWMIMCLLDFFNVQNLKDPYFCWGGDTTTYTEDDETSSKYGTGTVSYCYGLGYKVINYNRTNYSALEFGPFWSKDRTATIEED